MPQWLIQLLWWIRHNVYQRDVRHYRFCGAELNCCGHRWMKNLFNRPIKSKCFKMFVLIFHQVVVSAITFDGNIRAFKYYFCYAQTNCFLLKCFVAKAICHELKKNYFSKKIPLNVDKNKFFEKINYSITRMIQICPAAFRRISIIQFFSNFSSFRQIRR